MWEGYLMKKEVDDNRQLELMHLIRYVGYTSYVGIPTKKSFRKVSLSKYYPLEVDKKAKLSKEEIKEFFKQKDPVIQNGKVRGYMLDGKLFDSNDLHIGYVDEFFNINYIN